MTTKKTRVRKKVTKAGVGAARKAGLSVTTGQLLQVQKLRGIVPSG